MQYWIRVDGCPSDEPLTKEELFSKYHRHLTADTPCAKVGENEWGHLIDFFPDWQNLILQPSHEGDHQHQA